MQKKPGRKRGFFFGILGWKLAAALALLFTGLAAGGSYAASPEVKAVAERFRGVCPSAWGMDLEGVFRRAKTSERVAALTFDACDGRRGGYDAALIDFLRREQVPATLFLNERWIKAHPKTFKELASDPLFELGGHGTRHVPLSVTGKSAYGIRGSSSPMEAALEVAVNRDTIERIAVCRVRFFRAGTAHYDDVGLKIVEALGLIVAGFSVNGDFGATLKAAGVERCLLTVKPGDIVLCHMNHPESGTAEGVRRAVLKLRARGFRFVRLSELR